MTTGEYRFNNTDYIEINKPFMGNLYASALYPIKGKYILEILAPIDLMKSSITYEYEEYEETNYNIGERWSKNISELSASKWPLENANYYIEVNGIKVGDNNKTATTYRYEPENVIENKVEININPEDISNSNFIEDINTNEISKNGIELPEISQEEATNNILQDEDLKEILSSLMNSLSSTPSIYDEEEYLKHKEEQERKEREFFNKFRSLINIPDYFKNQSIIIADLIYRSEDIIPINKIHNLKFVFKNYTKHYVTRINLKLPFGKYQKSVEIHSEQWGEFTDKILIEGVIEGGKGEDYSANIPNGKKAIYVIYETINNVSVKPLFYPTEYLQSYDSSISIYDNTQLLKDKGKNGFNKYATFVGYIDENAAIADLELFQLVVTYQCNKEFVLWNKEQ
ncbi:hypothetical protein KQI86_05335 [Clostridium sp. MSJ-11]|uniref:Uncharacterized protein n=1 Tax=Clostridium mobile TaxID=2841512 RepID=A0ABS6EGZ9_9CLOT|nr:hypothetical protein [Clostridium mobile]MBU5483745.1 hypothetical protein [Clostridium mobile]